MHIFSPLHNDREKFQILLCPPKTSKPKERKEKKERDLKKNGIRKYYYHI